GSVAGDENCRKAGVGMNVMVARGRGRSRGPARAGFGEERALAAVDQLEGVHLLCLPWVGLEHQGYLDHRTGADLGGRRPISPAILIVAFTVIARTMDNQLPLRVLEDDTEGRHE